MFLRLISLFFWLLIRKRRFFKYDNATCHFIAPRRYTIKSLENYTKDLYKYKISSDKIDFIFWIEGSSDHVISGVKVKGYGENYTNLKKYLATQDPKKTIVSCTDDVYVILVVLLFKLLWGTKILYYNLSLLRANEIMIARNKRNLKYKLSSLIIRIVYKFADVITFTRIMSHEILYQSGEEAFLKFVTADHTIRGNINDLLERKNKIRKNSINPKSVALFTRFENMKRSEDAIEAYIKSVPYAENVPLFIYGGGSELESAKIKYKSNELLIFKDNIPQTKIIDKMMRSLFILAPHSGGVSIEAGIAERAVIAYGCNAMPEYIVDNFTGLLVDLNNATHFVECIDLLYKDQELRCSLGLNGLKFNMQRFSKTNMQRSYKQLTDKLEKIL